MKGINAILTTTARALAALALGCLCLLSCRKESTLGPKPAEQETLVTLRVTAGETPATRAADKESDDSGESYENYIDITKTHILFFIDGKFSEEFIPDAVEPVGSSKYPVEWTLRGPIYNPPTGDFKVVVLANCTLPSTLKAGETTIAQLCQTAVYTAYSDTDTEAFQPSAAKVLPMYGVQSYTGPMTFRHNVATDLGQIDLLRAMAKVIIRNTSGKSLQSATVNGLNRQGATAPLGLYEQTSKWTHANTYDKLAECLAVHLPNEAAANEDLATSRTAALKNTYSGTNAAGRLEEVWIGYFPEYLNTEVVSTGSTTANCSYINLAFSGIAQTYRIDFRYYDTPTSTDDGNRFDLKRNHIYEFEVTSVDSYSLNLTLIAKPWTVQEHTYSYDENVSAKDTGKLDFSWVGGDAITPTNNKMTFSSAGSIQATFTIDTPVGAEWIAVFEQKSGDLNHFTFADTQTDRTTGIVDGSQATLTIKQNDKTNGTATLVIYAHYGNVTFKASTMLGGEYILEKY